jgi:hypothetical protein
MPVINIFRAFRFWLHSMDTIFLTKHLFFMKKTLFLLPMVAGLLFFSCKKEAAVIEPPAVQELSSSKPDQLRTDFAKVLAKAIADQHVRELIKTEALKQFDNDYDVLLQLVKDKELRPGRTFASYLSSLAASEDLITNLPETLPLLTILVPQLPAFSAAQWNTNTQLPLVAVVNSDFSEKKRTPVLAFDHLGNEFSLPYGKAPDRPVIIVKENERILGHSKNDAQHKVDKSNYIFENQISSFYFIDDNFNAAKTGKKTNDSKFILYPFDVGLTPAVQAFSAGAISQRDYIYYNILNPGDQGPLNITRGEHLIGIAFDPAAESTLTEDWTEGAFEFQLDVLMFNGTSTLDKVSKVFTTPGGNFTNNEASFYRFAHPIFIQTWDMKKYGDTWKCVLTEIDPTGFATVNFSSSTKFGSNFTFNATTGQENKVNIGFGFSTEQTVTSNISIQITQDSDLCGEAVINFMQPVVLRMNIPPRGSTQSIYYEFMEANTGMARLLIYPDVIQ